MSPHRTRRLPRIKPWLERIVLLFVIALAYARLRAEIGNWQALLATAGTPLAILEGPWSGRHVAHRVRERLLARRTNPPGRPLMLWIPPAHGGQEIIISNWAGGPVAMVAPALANGDSPALPRGAPADRPEPSTEIKDTLPIGRSQHCVLFAVDIAQFTDARRDDEVQLALREALYRLLVESFEDSGIPWKSCVHEDRGDGAVVIIPAHMPTITIVGPLVDQIRTRLRRHNRLSSPVAQVRLRLAAHVGEVYRDVHGLAGKAVNHLFRILDARDLRDVLQDPGTEIALIVSDYLYENVILGTPNGVDPTAYREVAVEVKQFQARAWVLGPPRGEGS